MQNKNLARHVSMPYKNVLIITSSGGNGHIQVAQAKEQEIRSLNKSAKIVVKDLMLQWAMKPVGSLGVACWNLCQRKGNIFLQNIFIKFHSIADFIFWPHVFFKALRTLCKEKIDFVIDTQCVATSAIIKAVRLYNKVAGKNVFVEKIIVDLPTVKSRHFFKNIKKLSKQDRQFIKIVSLEPLLSSNETEEEFWQKNTGIGMGNIRYEKYFIRQGFKKYQNKKRDGTSCSINIKAQSEKECEVITTLVKKGPAQTKIQNNEVQFTIYDSDFLITIVLGSQPSFTATCRYVKKTLRFFKKNKFDRPVYLFVYCNSNKRSFLNEIKKMIDLEENYPENLTIVPFSFQKDEVLAQLFFRSDLTVTRAGGQTIMELLAVGTGKHFIHSEAKIKNEGSLDQLFQGITYWEGGNARYLMEKKEAEIITPHTYAKALRSTLHISFR